jgi:steroid 5-alpha reductase family enzyme
MTVLYLEALIGIALSFSILTGVAGMAQQRTGISGWVDAIWTFSLGACGVGSALWPIAGEVSSRRQWLPDGLAAIWSLRLGPPIARRAAGLSDDPRQIFILLQNHGAGSIPPASAMLVAARFPRASLRLHKGVVP